MHIHRHCARWRINAEAVILLDGSKREIRGLVRDVSFKGLCIAIPDKLPADTFLKLKVVLPQGLLCCADVWVVWHKTISGCQCYGLYFSCIPVDEKERIHTTVRTYFPELISRSCWGPGTDADVIKGGGIVDDRRIFQRFEVGFPVSFLDVNHGREGIADTFDVSAKGVGMTADAPLEPRTPLELWLRIPDQGEPLYTRGYVVWSEPAEADKYRMGVNLERADLMGLSRVMRLA